MVQITAISGAGVDVDAVGGLGIDADTSSASYAAGDFRSAATTGPAFIIGRTICGSTTIAALKVLHPSTPSGAVMEFGGGFISCTSIDIITAANVDYAIPVSLNGNIRYIPLMGSAAVLGGAKVS